VTELVYRRPTWIRRRLVNPLFRYLVLRGRLGQGEQNLMRVLRVRGRRSGRELDVPVRVAVRHGQRYIVSLLGQTEWARNLRAAGTAQLILGAAVETVTAHELSRVDKQAFLAWYCQVPAHRLSVRTGLNLDPANPAPDDLARAARQHPVFRLDPAAA
jgi:deazaflavin-dependent oxidoreductase (nitroreductase family)